MTADLRLTTTTARGAALVSAVSAALDASVAYHLASPGDTDAGKLGEMYAQARNTEADVLRLIIAMESDLARVTAERDGAVERARRARMAEQQAADAIALLLATETLLAEWRARAEEAARMVQASFAADDVAERAAAGKALVVWSLGVLPLDEAPGDDPLDKGPLDHGRSSDVNEEPAS